MNRLTNRLLLVATVFALLFAFLPDARAENAVTIHFFHLSTCSNCAEEEEALVELTARYDGLMVIAYEVTDPENADLFERVKEAFGDVSGTPYTVIGGIAFSGYNEQTKRDMEATVLRYRTEAHVDVVAKIVAGIVPDADDFDDFGYQDGDVIRLPILGDVAIADLSLGLAAVVLGFVDGFNPCALWILLLLISLVSRTGNRRRLWLLGGTFLLASAAMYFLFMAAWLNVALTVAAVVWVRIAVGAVAIGFGVHQLIRFFRKVRVKDAGCDVGDAPRKRRLADRIRATVASRSLLLALGGIVVLAVSVNFIELACSAGLPLLYTQILAYNELAVGAYYGFIGLYVLFFLLDDLAVFAVAVATMRVTGLSARYARWSTLFGGLVMVVLGFLLVFFPEIAMLRF